MRGQKGADEIYDRSYDRNLRSNFTPIKQTFRIILKFLVILDTFTILGA